MFTVKLIWEPETLNHELHAFMNTVPCFTQKLSTFIYIPAFRQNKSFNIWKWRNSDENSDYYSGTVVLQIILLNTFLFYITIELL